MAYSEDLAARIWKALAAEKGVSERKMFGGIAFMLRGNMCCGVIGEDLMLRVGPDLYEEALARPGARPMDFTGRPMKGMVYVDPRAIESDAVLRELVELGLAFAASLPAK
jgi:TfoX/Sxy family transcriptional regulator of competence genes